MNGAVRRRGFGAVVGLGLGAVAAGVVLWWPPEAGTFSVEERRMFAEVRDVRCPWIVPSSRFGPFASAAFFRDTGGYGDTVVVMEGSDAKVMLPVSVRQFWVTDILSDVTYEGHVSPSGDCGPLEVAPTAARVHGHAVDEQGRRVRGGWLAVCGALTVVRRDGSFEVDVPDAPPCAARVNCGLEWISPWQTVPPIGAVVRLPPPPASRFALFDRMHADVMSNPKGLPPEIADRWRQAAADPERRGDCGPVGGAE